MPSSTSGTQPPGSSNGPTPSAGSSSKAANSNTGVIVGSVLGGVAVTAIAVVAVIFVQRRRRAVSLRPSSRMSITENIVGNSQSLFLERDGDRARSAYTSLDNVANSSFALPPHQGSTPPRMMKAQEVGLVGASRSHADSPGNQSLNYSESLVTAAAVAASWHPADTANTQDSPHLLGPNCVYNASTVTPSISATEHVVRIRAEVQELRRVMEQMRGAHFELEPPPVYQED